VRPICLYMSAFGPFAGVEKINFDELGDNPLFLINGPTGSGKSTIFDAICFALYGETTGNEREAKQMRCDHADPSTLTEVTLEFKITSGSYRITRIPDQVRPKARGEGVTEQKAQAHLYQLDGDDEKLLVGPKITEVTGEIINLTGLSAEQFRQVMVLPQGKFRDLLLAKSEDREKIFEQLFQTHVYSRLQTKLRDQANFLTSQIKNVLLQQNAMLEASELENREQLQTQLKTITEDLKELEQKKRTAEAVLRQAHVALQEAQLSENAFIEQIQTQNKYDQLLHQQSEIDQQKIKLDGSIKAQEISPSFQETEKQKITLIKNQQELSECRAVLNGAKKALRKLEEDKKKIPGQEETFQKLNAEITMLESYRQRSQQLQDAQKNLVIAEKALNTSQKMLSDKKSQLQRLRKELEQCEKTLQTQNQILQVLPEKKIQLEKLEEQGKAIRKITDLHQSHKKIEKEITGLENQENEINIICQQKLRDKEIYEQAWQKGQASVLASHLSSDKPCPVCGSIDHPLIAYSDDKLPTEQELNKAQKLAEESRLQMEKIIRDKLIKQEERKNILSLIDEEKISGTQYPDLSLDEIREHYAQLKNEIEALQKTAEGLLVLQKQIDGIKSDIRSLEIEMDKAQKINLENSSVFAAAKAELSNKENELPEQYRTADTLENAISQLVSERDSLKRKIEKANRAYQQAREANVSAETALASATANEKNSETLYNTLLTDWQRNLQQSVFESEQHFLNAKLEKNQEQRLIDIIRQYEDEKLLTQKQLDEKNSAIKNKTRPDINKLKEVEEIAESNKNRLDSEYHKTEQRQYSLIKTRDKLKKSIIQLEKLEKQYGVIGKLSDVSNGKNPHNLSLQRFVLSVLLDDVLTEASYRLHKMSKGRYQLYRKESVGDKRSKSGLEMEVEDSYTGKLRPAATLSGGESFMAALALALGLSDVVQAYAGGIRLDTLFIDEGFGSLDPESLELAINTLLELRASGRMVGVISHVEEMKRIIDVRLDVITDRGISSTKLVTH